MKDYSAPAFPSRRINNHGEDDTYSEGMTLRDYFAAAAMQGLLVESGTHDCERTAHFSYYVADCMLQEREKC